MKIRIAFLSGLVMLLAVAAGPLAAAAFPTLGSPVTASSLGCGCSEEERAELVAHRDRIAGAESLESAQELAVAQTRLAERALRGALWLAPHSEAMERAHRRLAGYEARVAQADSRERVAAEFGELVQLASLDSPIMSDGDFRARADCDYSNGEIIAIVIGFILGIIPGIILLFLLC